MRNRSNKEEARREAKRIKNHTKTFIECLRGEMRTGKQNEEVKGEAIRIKTPMKNLTLS